MDIYKLWLYLKHRNMFRKLKRGVVLLKIIVTLVLPKPFGKPKSVITIPSLDKRMSNKNYYLAFD